VTFNSHSESHSATTKCGSERYLHNKIISGWQRKRDLNYVDVEKQLTEQDSAVWSQLQLTTLCWAVTHLCLLMLRISNMLTFLLVICITFCDGLLPFPHSVPPTSKQVSNQEITLFWLQQVYVRLTDSHLQPCMLTDGYNELQKLCLT
jgi:hypothetical protein